MALPKQVQQQADAVAQFDKQITEMSVPADSTDPTAPAPSTEVPSEPAPAPSAPQPAPAPTPQAAPEPWEQRYRSLQGMFNATVPALEAQVKELKEQLTARERASEPATPAEPEPREPKVTGKDVEAFGGDLIDLIKRAASDMFVESYKGVHERFGRLEDSVSKLQAAIGGVSENLTKDRRVIYFQELARLVPDYEVVNVDQRFTAWLSEVDPLSGQQRQAYLEAAFNNFDAARTAVLFNAWKQSVGTASAPTATPQPQAPTAADELRRQVAPTSSRASTPAPSGNEQGGRFFTTREVDKFYTDVAKGLYRNNEAERARIETEIDLAVSQGRIRP